MTKRMYGYLVIPALVLVTVFLMVPLLNIIAPSFFKDRFTFENYLMFLSDPFYIGIIWRTIKVSFITTLVCVAIGVPTAYFISIQDKKVKGLLNAVIMFPLLTNAVVRGFAWMNILGTRGVVNSFLMNVKLISEPLSLLYTEFAIIVGSVYLFLPVMITTLIPVMESIDDDIILATQSLGAKPLNTFIKIIVPLSFSGILIGSVLVFTGVMSAYTTPSLLGGNKNMMLATLIFQQANQLANWTNAGMISLIMIVISLGLMKLLNVLNGYLDQRGTHDA